jgi:hypothetical protein
MISRKRRFHISVLWLFLVIILVSVTFQENLYPAQVAITNVLLWFCIWTPYAVVNMIAQYGNLMLVTPLASQLPAFFGEYFSYIFIATSGG